MFATRFAAATVRRLARRLAAAAAIGAIAGTAAIVATPGAAHASPRVFVDLRPDPYDAVDEARKEYSTYGYQFTIMNPR